MGSERRRGGRHPRPRPGHDPTGPQRLAVLPRPAPRLLHRDRQAMTARQVDRSRSVVIREGKDASDDDADQGRHGGQRHRDRRRRRAGRRRDDRRRARAGLAPCSGSTWRATSTRWSTRPASTSSPAASTPTPTWSCRSAAPPPRTPSRPAPGRRPGAAPPRSSTSRCSATASGSRTAWPPGTPRPRATARSTTASTRSSAASTSSRLKAMDTLIDEGITSFKLFMAYPGVFYSDDAQILQAMQKSAETGLLTMMHAENGPAIDVLAEQLYAQGKTDPVLPRHRPGLADGGGGHPPGDHDRPPDRRAALRRARQRQAGRGADRRRPGPRPERVRRDLPAVPLPVAGGAARRAAGWGFEGAKWVCSTPLRSRAEGHQDHMWQALRTNDLQMVSTDHCPFCMKEQKELGIGDFRAIPNGIGGDRAPDGPDVRRAWSPARSPCPAGSS